MEMCSNIRQCVLHIYDKWVRATEHTLRDLFRVLERRDALAEIVERGGGVLVEHLGVVPWALKRLLPNLMTDAPG